MILLQAVPFVRAFLGCVLLLSGIGKLLDLRGTRQAVGDYDFPLLQWRGLVARLLPLLELTLGAALILQLMPLLASFTAVLTFSIFLIGVGKAVSRGKTMECHCFGVLTREDIGRPTLVRLTGLLLMALFVVGADLVTTQARGFLVVDPSIDHPARLLPIATAASVGAVGMLLLGQVVATARTIRRAKTS